MCLPADSGMRGGDNVGVSVVILEQSMGARNRVGIGLSYRSARLRIGWRNPLLGIDS